MTQPAPKRWAGAYHAQPYRANNSLRGVRRAARTGHKAIDLDQWVTKDGVIVCTHGPAPIRDGGFYDPKGKIRPNAWVHDLTWAEVKRLRSKDGYRIWKTRRLLKAAAKLGLRVEFEAKDARGFNKRKAWRKVARMKKRFGLDLQMKTISNIGNPGKRLKHAHAVGLTTILLPRGSRKAPSRWKKNTDYVRGKIMWT